MTTPYSTNALRERLAKLTPSQRALLAQQLASTDTATTVPRRTNRASAPLTYNQELLWAVDQAMPGVPAYNVPRAFRVRGLLDLDHLQRAIAVLIERHETLRTAFTATNAGPRQEILPARPAPFETVVVPGGPAEQEAALPALLAEASRFIFDLTRGELLRVTIFRLSEADRVVLLLSHHIVCDEWSRDVLFRDLSSIYNGLCGGQDVSLPDLPVQYGDYAEWQRAGMSGAGLDPQIAYWRNRLRDLPSLDLPTDRPRPVAPSLAGARRRYHLDRDAIDAIGPLAARLGVTPFMMYLTVFKIMLMRYASQSDVAVGSPISSRSHPELEGLIGYFPNVLVLRTDLSGEPTFATAVGRVRETCLDGYAHQSVPLEMLALELKKARSQGFDPLFRVLFLNLDRDAVPLTFDGASVELVPTDFRTSKFDITLSTRETPEGLAIAIEYNTDLFDAATIDRMAGHFEMLLRGATADSDLPITAIPMLTAAERRHLLVDWNSTSAPYPGDLTLTALLERQNQATPDGVAVWFGGSTLTFAKLHGRANRLAQHLRGIGVGPGVLVGLCVERSIELVVGLLGILKAGGGYVPLDPDYPTERLAFMIEDAAAPVLLTQSHLHSRLPAHGGHTIQLDTDWERIEGLPPVPPVPLAGPGDVAYMIYTSGSTGRPKGALNCHAGIVNRLLWMQEHFQLGSGDTVLQKTPYSFDVSVWEFFLPLMTGARLVVAAPGGHRDPGYLANLIEAEHVTVLHFVPSMLRAFLAEPTAARCQGIREIICSGEALSYGLMRQCQDQLPARLTNLYGPTEAAVDVTCWTCDRTYPGHVVPIGRPIANTTTYVLDAIGGPVPIGVPGELYLGGIQVGMGYHNRPELTAEKFVPDPFADGGRLYRTGDLARYLSDGNIEFLGRIDHQIKLRGFRVELGEVEAGLASHPMVHEAVVHPHTDDAGDTTLTAYIVPHGPGIDTTHTVDTVEKWEAVFDSAYSTGTVAADGSDEAEFNIKGWVSSYNLRPLPAAEMHEWVDQTCDRIRMARPNHVLEIGCGTGLLLFRIAPDTARYVGIDVSRTGLDAIRAADAFQRLPQVELQQGAAHELDRFRGERFDTIVINSVIQYFPSVDYLVDVIRRSLELLTPTGTLFLGDVRSLPLLEALHGSVAAFQSGSDATVGSVRERLSQRLWEETELVVDPLLFYRVAAESTDLTVGVMPKLAQFRNELSKFRYDVTLRRGIAPRSAEDATVQDGPTSIDTVVGILQDGPPLVRLTNLKDRRLERDLRLAEALDTAGSETPIGALISEVERLPNGGFEPGEIRQLAQGYDLEIYWTPASAPGTFEAVLRRPDRYPDPVGPSPSLSGFDSPWNDYVHRPHPPSLSHEVVASLRAHLGTRLPDFMVPTQFVRMDSLPLTPSGKIDRKRLVAPKAVRLSGTYTAPRTALETAIASIWAEILRVDRVSVTDSFLELGGHSLQAMRIIGRIRQAHGVTVPLPRLLIGASVADLAAVVERLSAAPEADDEMGPMVSVARDAFRRPGAPTR